MPQNRSRFVLLCQQSLALGLVVAVAVPAASLVDLDIVPTPDAGAGTAPSAATRAPAERASSASEVAVRTVRPTVSTVPMTGVSRAGLRALAENGPETRGATGATGGGAAARLASATTGVLPADALAALTAPQRVAGLATVGVTWANGVRVPESDITISVRTKRDGGWSRWQKVPYHEEDAPDPGSAEARGARPGTDPLYVGAVADVQLKAVTDNGRAPRGMSISLVDPGHTVERAEQPAIDTGTLALSAAETSSTTSAAARAATPKPKIFSRAQWGADERLRDHSSLHYGEVHGGFVHHTVNANRYSRSQVPAIIRGIYAYHTQSRGWSDVGYNFLVDRFGRIWEGRYGGVDRPVVGAHTLGYNDDAFAGSAIGNFDIVRPPSRVVRAFARLFAWKLSLHGVRANATHQWITKRYLNAILGHRDVGQTACPGRYLYAKIPRIRRLAAAEQRSWSGRVRATNLAGSRAPDLVVRNRRTHELSLVRTHGVGRYVRVTRTRTYVPNADLVMNAGDWNRDGRGDVIVRSRVTGNLYLLRGNGRGRFSAPALMRRDFGSVRLLSAVGDMTGDGRPDLMGQPRRGAMRIFPGNGRTGFAAGYVAHAAISTSQQLGVGLWDGDGSPDTVTRTSHGTLVLYPGNGPGGLTGGTRIGSLGRRYDWVVAAGDLSGDRRTDLVVRTRGTGTLSVLRGTSRGFTAPRTLARGLGRFDLAG